MCKYSSIDSKEALASTIGVSVRQITGLVYGIRIDNCYHSFYISKKNGKKRQISAPNKSLKYVQRRLCRLLIEKLNDFYLEYNIKNQITHGFFKGKSIKTNALPHRNKRYVLNIDLKDFFGSIHFGRVQGFFLKNNYFKLPKVATLIAQLTCYNGKLPQGAPTSPIISNLICQILDYKIIILCKKYRLTYTRYADDLTFSTNNKVFSENYTLFLEELKDIVTSSGFDINAEKTHFQKFNSRQTVTGLSVNKKLNVQNDFYKKTRSMANTLYKTGEFTIDGKEGTIKKLEGRFSFINELVKYNNRLVEDRSLTSNIIEYKKNLLRTQEKLFRLSDRKIKTLAWDENLRSLSMREKDYQKFLFYKYFIANKKTTLITEGKTDPRYIKAALKHYYSDFAGLVSSDGNNFKYNVSFLSRSNRMRYFFGFKEGGGGELQNLLRFFTEGNTVENLLEYFRKIIPLKPSKPVIFLVDNEFSKDDPLYCVAKFLKNKIHTTEYIEKKLHTDYFYHVGLNTFIITLPISNIDMDNKDKSKLKGTDIEIEDLYNLNEINEKLIKPNHGGKIFNKKKEDNSKYIGKEIFSKFMISNYSNSCIDYSKFRPLLDLINDLSENYHLKTDGERYNTK
jgi:RNA-directed DNA polymerase